MIDPVTGWFEMQQIPNKTAAEVTDIAEKTWFTRYPLPQRITLDSEEFMAEFLKMVREDYGLKIKPITTRNPQANAIIERVHQTMGSIIRSFDVQHMDEKDPWSGILAATMFAVRATYHITTLQATPMQLVFGCDAILNIKHITDWEHIRQRKQERIIENNKRENKNRREYKYALGNKVLLKARKKSKHNLEWEGAYELTQVNDNGTVCFQKGIVNDVVNIHRIKNHYTNN
jgi:hypothetical protein